MTPRTGSLPKKKTLPPDGDSVRTPHLLTDAGRRKALFREHAPEVHAANSFWSGTIDSVAVLPPNPFLVFKLPENADKRNFSWRRGYAFSRLNFGKYGGPDRAVRVQQITPYAPYPA